MDRTDVANPWWVLGATPSPNSHGLGVYHRVEVGGPLRSVLSKDACQFAWRVENGVVTHHLGCDARSGLTAATMQCGYDDGVYAMTNESLFVYDGWNVIEEVKTQGESVLTDSYVWGLDLSGTLHGAGGIGGLVAACLSGTEGATTVFYTYDANGNVGQLLDASTATNVLAHYEYDPYGNVLVAKGASARSNAFRFSTKYLDDQTGLYYYGHRFLSPQLGRWISRDPMGEEGGPDLYASMMNNPTCVADPFGLTAEAGGNPWDLLEHYLFGNGNLELDQAAIEGAKHTAVVGNEWDKLERGARSRMAETPCGSSGIYSRMAHVDDFWPFDTRTGKWQLLMDGTCSWECRKSLTTCCCECTGKCTADFTISKKYTFELSVGGNPENWRVWWLDSLGKARRRNGEPNYYYISGNWSESAPLAFSSCNSFSR